MNSSSSSNSTPAFLPFCSPSIDDADIAAVVETLRSGWITTGPRCGELEQAICDRTGAQSAVAVSSATAGMHLVLKAMDIGPGDEVITPSMTWVSTPNMIHLMGATPVFVDVDRDTLLVSAESVEAAITDRTKAIIPVHYAGVPCDLDSLRAVANTHGIPLIERCGSCDRNQIPLNGDRSVRPRHLLAPSHQEHHHRRRWHSGQ